MKVEHAVDRVVSNMPVQRLCNEIQLFDLCDLESCSFKEGRFCSKSDLLAAFEKISDAEVVRPEMYLADDPEEGDESGDEEYDDAYGDEECVEEGERDDY